MSFIEEKGSDKAQLLRRKSSEVLRDKPSDSTIANAAVEPFGTLNYSTSSLKILTPVKTVDVSTSQSPVLAFPARSTSRIVGEIGPSRILMHSEPENDASHTEKSLPNELHVKKSVGGYERAVNEVRRHLVYQGHAWQVITTSIVKDRQLFLFEDILVIAKQVPYHEEFPSARRFEIKSVLNVNRSKLALQDATHKSVFSNSDQKAAIAAAVKKFSSNPVKAIAYLIAKRVLPCTEQAVAHFLHTTPNLSRRQMAKFLGLPDHLAILRCYFSFFAFERLRIDVALRLFLGAFRLPSEVAMIDNILDSLARRWVECNADIFGSDPGAVFVAIRLIFSIMALNAEFHGTFSSATTTPKSTKQVFVDAFLSCIDSLAAGTDGDRSSSLPRISFDSNDPRLKNMLNDIYISILSEKLDMAEVEGADAKKLQWSIGTEASNMIPITDEAIDVVFPTTLSLKEPSAMLTLSIGAPIPGLQVKVIGVDIQSEPPVLDFSETGSVTFRFKGLAPGRKLLMFSKTGRGSKHVAPIPTRGVLIEPAFMKYKFQLSMKVRTDDERHGGQSVDQAATEKRYLFAVSDTESLQEWVSNLKKVTRQKGSLTGACGYISVEGGQNPYGTVSRPKGMSRTSLNSSDSDEEPSARINFKSLKSKVMTLGSKGPLIEQTLIESICNLKAIHK
jgi:hypothetical protein